MPRDSFQQELDNLVAGMLELGRQVEATLENMVGAMERRDAGLAAGFAGPQDVPELKSVLGLPDEFHPIGVIPVGRPLPDKRSPSLGRGWLPFEEFAHWERW